VTGGYLLDVNVLIALVDPAHVQHEPAHEWFSRVGHRSWSTCAITQNGLLRILGHPRYPNSPGNPGTLLPMLRSLCSHPGHAFWPDDITILDSGLIAGNHLIQPGQVTDTYLLALAVQHGGRLATFDRKLVAATVTQGADALVLI
jgi:uncharacterized protein